ncbi:MAG: S46 family peptidase [candidate division KSB1 bacterium]|nr:S46 family peptidase [candidate division KSB1 bacterium]MDZ7285991.1 S46 family peptidase [candidate division KSB1 bacterium]MDZ7299023.1 S46 family peptidase [candidate division KSB1 bacterium]MDZ7309612.1 S46 family peptidase [candidate division KSB1 bacterium]MDZ7353623.1 S46 family peptidase [candidate division KSB1 bacterium]
MECRNILKRLAGVLVLAGMLFLPGAARPDEGMWTFDNPPLKQLQERYGFTPTQAWLDHIRLASVRFNDGGSGSFVSPNGLVLTNHHVALGQLQKLSSPENNYVANGFLAMTPAAELKCPDLELNVLISMENVTARVQGAAKPGMTDQQALQARQKEIARIEKESLKAAGLHSEVVSLYQGGEYWLYRYKKYTDVRLVFAPEQQAAFYGGDPDNFTYPRYDLDMTLFRVYENDKPVQSKHYLKWNTTGAAVDELVFVSGHPGSTDRLQTVAQLVRQRDYSYPYRLKMYNRRLALLRRYAAQGPEQERQAMRDIFGIENALKAWTGEYNGLRSKELMAKKEQEENDFRALIAGKPEWQAAYGDAWDMIANAEKKQIEMLPQLRYRDLRFSRLANLAKNLVQYATEIKKKDEERLEGFHDSQLEGLKFRLLSPAPIYPALEEVSLVDALQESHEQLGPDDPFIKTVLGGRTPAEVARELIGGTKLADVAVRKALLEGGESAIKASTDPLIVLMRELDGMMREQNRLYEEQVESVLVAAGEKIGKARFAVYGKSAYPDATFTLRLSYGKVAGYPMNGTKAPAMTTLYGLFDRAYSFNLQPPFNLPKRFFERQDKLDLRTPVNFVTTNDIIGGNSGSPVINKQGELVGLIFDGNIESLVGRYVYSEEANRAVAVHPAYMIEAMRKLYDAGVIADELENAGATSSKTD